MTRSAVRTQRHKYLSGPVADLSLCVHAAQIPAFSRECLKRGLAVVVVGFPAVPLLLGRVRFCLSAAHTTEMLEGALAKIGESGSVV